MYGALFVCLTCCKFRLHHLNIHSLTINFHNKNYCPESNLQKWWSCTVFNPRRACAAKVTVLGLCVCVCFCLSPLILALQGPSRLISNTNGSGATRARKLMWRFCLNGGVREIWRSKQATKPPTSTDRYRFRLSGTLAVLRWRGAGARTITRFQRARGVAVRWGSS